MQIAYGRPHTCMLRYRELAVTFKLSRHTYLPVEFEVRKIDKQSIKTFRTVSYVQTVECQNPLYDLTD